MNVLMEKISDDGLVWAKLFQSTGLLIQMTYSLDTVEDVKGLGETRQISQP